MKPATDARSGPSIAPTGGDLTARIGGTLTGRIVQEFFSNSAHFPIANILLEMLRAGVGEYLLEPDFYAIVAAAVVQAIVLGRSYHLRRPMPFLGNLVGPTLYTAIEVGAEGAVFFAGPHHLAYWGFALTIGCAAIRPPAGGGADPRRAAGGRERRPRVDPGRHVLDLRGTRQSEVRHACGLRGRRIAPVRGVRRAAARPLLLGIANIVDLRRLSVLRSTASRLKDLSEWSMGAELVSRAVSDPRGDDAETDRTDDPVHGHPGFHHLDGRPEPGGRGRHAQHLLRGLRARVDAPPRSSSPG